MTVPERRDTLLPRTLASLALAGFDRPRLFIDGGRPYEGPAWEGYEQTSRLPRIGVHGNWTLSVYELFIRNPVCHRYALFQDDLVTYRNLRTYLDACPLPSAGYWNLYTFPQNARLCPTGHTGWYESNQCGLGAVALIFSREALLMLLSSKGFTERPATPDRGTRNVDGGIVTALSDAHNGPDGWREYVHSPSLVQHTGLTTTITWASGSSNQPHPQAPFFRGESYDARDLLQYVPAPAGVPL